MGSSALVAIIIFISAYVLIVTEKIHRTIVALAGGMLMIFTGILSQEAAISHIDFNTIGLLIGMMIIVNITAETGLFNYLAIWATKKVKAEPIKILVVMSLITAVCSAVLDNVTTVLLTVPVTFSIAKKLKLSPQPYLIAQILSANIGGTATLIGDPPNIMIGSAVKELTFMAFLQNLGLVCAVILLVTLLIIAFIYRKKLVTRPELKYEIMLMDEQAELKDTGLLKKSLSVLAITITFFVLHSQLQLESATVALTGASLLPMLTFHSNEKMLEKMFSKVEWLAIFFFVGLFILVGALVDTGVIEQLATTAMSLTQGNLAASSMLVLWLSAIASAFIDNIPFVATMIPLIKEMGQLGMTNLEPLWWSLSLGACLGGNGTLVGASANVVVASLAAQQGHKLSFLKFMYIAFPLMILSIIISSMFIYLKFL